MADLNKKQKLQQRAKQTLPPAPDKPRSRAETLRTYKRFRKIEEARLLMAHRAGGGGLEITEARADIYDVALKHLWSEVARTEAKTSSSKLPVSIVATGGYGRRQMNPFSDVDLMFLVPDKIGSALESTCKLISTFITLLWDIGFKVGDSSTRSVSEAFRAANQDNQVKTALIEGRHIAGNETAFTEFKLRFDATCMDGHETEFLRMRQRDLADRHSKHENTPFVQEPNIKNGCGGLRDHQNAIWTTYAKHRTVRLRDLIKKDLLSLNALRDMERAYDFLLRVRNEMHYVEKREQDTLTLRLQGVVATNLGYRHKKILIRIEEFMRDYYQHTTNLLHRTAELMDRYHLQAIETEKPSLVQRLLKGRAPKTEKFDGFISKHERIYAEHDNIFTEDPPRLIRLFVHTQQRHLRLSPELHNLVQKNFHLINISFRYNKAARESFEAILNQKGDVARTLRQMHRVGVLGRYMPEFGALTCLVQHEFFHRYTADEHTLRTIDKLDELAGTPQPGLGLYQRLFHDLQEPYILYLALLLHDSGRAHNTATHSDASATLAHRVARRFQIKGARLRLLMFLVDHHLTLYRTATSKNIEDPKVIAEFADIIRSKQNLDALVVMTLVDSQGTSDKGWNSWKESLILHLYRTTVAYLNDPSDFLRSATAPLRELGSDIRKKLDTTFEHEIAAHVRHMPRSYFNFRDADTIAVHIKQLRDFFRKVHEDPAPQSLLPILHWDDRPEQGISELTVLCWDRHLLLARVSGALSAMNINILGADLYRRSDDCVIDIFRVARNDFTPVTNDRVKARVKNLIEGAFKEEDIDFSSAITEHRRRNKGFEEVAAEVPQRVLINNNLSNEYTVIELQALDRIGLLHDVFMAIGRLGLSVCHARISTEKGVAIDSIYLQDKAEQKIHDPDVLEQLKNDVRSAVFVPVIA
ncbi:[protein-PII] uridylyltransferase [Phragmitibacter flavus]|uniref:Bifunctional uridylyltransferase/uridylyl-removing enzyme n=1 Tax=Phragmitibacter flavus TaxID=2576071 RepID=A0A5R8KA95_9BACT|nr:[protein-PII] uridylyltransferase [Phragmitibacter flavus]TLD69240.1 [protein-PII] uridylyltransferase [Phragmitibacter flavus]